MNRILQTVIFTGIVAVFIGCRSTRDFPYEPYPEYPGDRPVVIVSDGPHPGDLPPGHAKKIYGTKSAKPFAPGQQKKYGYAYSMYPLIIVRTPGIVISRYQDGRYYYRHPDGLIYWQGFDGRFYLDESLLVHIRYHADDYDDWKYRGKKNKKGKRK